MKFLVIFFFPAIGRWLNFSLWDREAQNFLANIIKSRLADSKNEFENTSVNFLNVFIKALDANEAGMKKESDDEVEEHLDQFEEDAKIIGIKGNPQSLYSNQEEYETVITSNLLLLFFAGFDTQSNVLSVVLYYLATNHEGKYFHIFK